MMDDALVWEWFTSQGFMSWGLGPQHGDAENWQDLQGEGVYWKLIRFLGTLPLEGIKDTLVGPWISSG